MGRIFNRFREHRQGVFQSYDPETKVMTWLADGASGPAEEWVQHGLEIDLESIATGTRLRIQDGPMTRHSSDMRGGRRYIAGPRGSLREVSAYTGAPCISAIAHPCPRISLVALRLLEAVFLPDYVPGHIRDYAAGASTRQDRAVVRTNRWDLNLRIRDGLLTASRRLSNSVIVEGDRIAFDCEGMPDTLIAALHGRPVRDLVGHHALTDDDLLIDRIRRSTTDTRAWADIVPVILSPDEALARLRPVAAIAA